MQRATFRCRSASYILVLIIYALPTLSVADEFVVTSHPSILRLSHSRPVENSPGGRIGSITICSRVHIRRLSRIHNIDKFFHALKLTSSVSQGDGLFRIQTIEFCLHRNASLGICMCSAGLWRKVPIKGSFVKSLSPFEDWFLDVRLLPDPSRIVEITTDLEFLPHRVIFLVLGFCMMITAHFLSQSITFYYGGAMTIGIILVMLIVLYQGMKLLPTGRKSSLAVVMYSSIVGVAASLLHHISGLLRAALVEIGIYEDMHKPLGIFLLACFILAGAWFGYWGVRKLVLTDEGLIDTDVAYFVEWAVLIFGSIMILQSSLDTSLTAQALIIAIVASAASRTHGKLKFLRLLFRMIFKCVYTIFRTMQFLTPFERTRQSHKFRSASPTRAMNRRQEAQNNSINSVVTRRRPNDGDDYYSTFHRTPERKMFKKEEWEAFSRAETSKALRDLASSPDFNRWVADNIENMNLTPPSATATHVGRAKRNRLFGWWRL